MDWTPKVWIMFIEVNKPLWVKYCSILSVILNVQDLPRGDVGIPRA